VSNETKITITNPFFQKEIAMLHLLSWPIRVLLWVLEGPKEEVPWFPTTPPSGATVDMVGKPKFVLTTKGMGIQTFDQMKEIHVFVRDGLKGINAIKSTGLTPSQVFQRLNDLSDAEIQDAGAIKQALGMRGRYFGLQTFQASLEQMQEYGLLNIN